jgi:hypothetical protein
MPYYRLYFVDSEGAIDSVAEFSADDDAEAGRISADHAGARRWELWCRSRLVDVPALRGAAPSIRPSGDEQRLTGAFSGCSIESVHKPA